VSTRSLLLLGLLGVAAWMLLTRAGAHTLSTLTGQPAADSARLRALIGTLPPVLTRQQLQPPDKLSPGQGAQLGLSTAAPFAPLAGPYAPIVLGAGAAGGAIAGIFV